jgi:hypothetical protein
MEKSTVNFKPLRTGSHFRSAATITPSAAPSPGIRRGDSCMVYGNHLYLSSSTEKEHGESGDGGVQQRH